MPSLLPGYEYDIFISYRQKDNRSDQWVTNFVQALREELDATFKEPISIYFDSNPHDGLLETHDVDGSLKEKIKCLVFIPIVSQTYCDPNSFAWQKELLAFIDLAKTDQFGLDVKLSDRNVAKRVLPVRIHDIDDADKKLFEEAIGGLMRPVDFIYKTPGVNRPLAASEVRPDVNTNRTIFKDQVNKVANAIKQLLNGMKNSGGQIRAEVSTKGVQQSKSIKAPMLVGIISLLLLTSLFFIYRYTTRSSLDKSIAVLPFVNLSNDPSQEYFSDGMTEEIINRLANIKELKVIGRSSSFQFKGKNPDLRDVGHLLGVATALEGSVRRSGNQLRVTVQLIRVSDGSHFWSQSFNREIDDIFKIQDEIAEGIAAQMRLSFGLEERKAVDPGIYDLYLRARANLAERGTGVERSVAQLEEIISMDSTYQPAWAGLAQALNVMYVFTTVDSLKNRPKHFFPRIDYALKKALSLNPNDPEALSAKATHQRNQLRWEEAMVNFEQAIALNDKSPAILEDYVQFLVQVGYSEKALPYARQMIELDPLTPIYLLSYANALDLHKEPVAASMVRKKALALDPTLFSSLYESLRGYLNTNQVDSARYLLSHYSWPTRLHEDFSHQLDALETGKLNFEFDRYNQLTLVLNELDRMDLFYDLGDGFWIAYPYSPPYFMGGLTYHAEKSVSDPRMKKLLRDLGLVAFWEKHGWPDRCHPTTNGDFICE